MSIGTVMRRRMETTMHTPVLVLGAALIGFEALTFQGCASITSQVDDLSKPVSDGVVYYMPRRPIKVSITLPAKIPATKATPGVPATPTSPAIPPTPEKPEVIPPP